MTDDDIRGASRDQLLIVTQDGDEAATPVWQTGGLARTGRTRLKAAELEALAASINEMRAVRQV